MAYCALIDVQALNARRNNNTVYGASTVPTATQVTALIVQIAAEIDTILAAQSIATPVTAPASFVSFLLNLNARGAAALADMAAFPESDGGPGASTHGQTLWKLYQQGLDGLKDGTAIDPAVSDSGQEPTAETYLTENPDNDPYADGFSDGEQPVFSMTRQLRDF